MRVRWSTGFILFLAVIVFQNELSYTLTFMSAACLHEAGHLLCLKALNIKKPELSLGLCGAVIKADTSSLSYRSEILVFISGAAVNLLASFTALIVLRSGFNTRLVFFFFANLFYAGLNILPLKNFDGGRCLECILLLITDPFKVDRIMNKVYFIGSAVLLFITVYGMQVFGFNLTLVLVAVWAVFQCIPSKPCCLSAS